MLKTLDTHPEFEALARAFLASHPDVPHEWREIRGVDGGRTDLICYPGQAGEVFASLSSAQITVGDRGGDKDFENFGRSFSDAQLAQEAFEQFLKLLARHWT